MPVPPPAEDALELGNPWEYDLWLSNKGACPKCHETHFGTHQLLVVEQDVKDGEWEGMDAEQYSEETETVRVWCLGCGLVLFAKEAWNL
jgi:hypothetical protein